jgi:protoheme IX farnesyltransferase
MTDASVPSPALESEAEFKDFIALLKPRVMVLVVFTAFVGLMAAPAQLHPFLSLVAIVCIAIGGGAAGALNMWWDADIDQIMKRTKKRPIPSDKVTPDEAKIIGFVLSGFSVVMLGLATNFYAAGLLAFTIFFYIAIYTIWLKRSTPQNIVIGGAAGAFPPMIGWAAVTGTVSFESILMFALVFMWTPPHFWALALFTRTDYDNAEVPMLTVTHGRKSTSQHILAYTLLLAALGGATALSSLGGPIYIVSAVLLNIRFLIGAIKIWQRNEEGSERDSFLVERKFFNFSLFYLFALFAAILADSTLNRLGVWGWV